MTGTRPSHRRERGSTTLEAVVVTPVLILFLLLAVGMGRYELARQQIIGAARAAAEAVAVAPDAGSAPGAALAGARPVLTGAGHACASSAVEADDATFAAGGWVSVAVTCRVELGDLVVPGFPGSFTLRVTQRVPIDPYRSVG